MQAALRECNLYPDNDACELKHKLAQRHRVPPEQVLVGAGLTDLLGIIAHTLLAPGLNAVTSERSFIVYPMATRAARGKLLELPMSNDGFDLQAIAAAIKPATRIVFLANPNNPTGTLFDAETTDEFLAHVREEVIVVLDEAYYEYAEHFARERGIHYSHSLDYIREGRNVVVLRTFSKVHGLAGVRIGYALGPPALLARLAEMRSTYSISRPAQAAALAALEDEEHVRQAVSGNAREATRVTAELSRLGYHPVPTWANFIYCDIGEDAELFSERLKSNDVIIRPLGPWGAPSAIRVTIGTPEQNQALLAAFEKVM